jgi:hypothetical protein
MAIQPINIGNRVNDGLGDDLRTAFQKVNNNFDDLSASLTVTASNLGSSVYQIFAQKVGANLEFRSLIPGSKITLDRLAESIRINSTQPDAFTSITTNAGVIVADNEASPPTLDITIQGAPTYTAPLVGQSGRNIRVIKTDDRVISIDTVLDLDSILLSFDFGPADADFENPIQMSLATLNVDFGTINNPGRFSLDLGGI